MRREYWSEEVGVEDEFVKEREGVREMWGLHSSYQHWTVKCRVRDGWNHRDSGTERHLRLVFTDLLNAI